MPLGKAQEYSRASVDPDGDLPLAFGWTQSGGPSVDLNRWLPVTAFTAPGSASVRSFTLTVTDALGMPSLAPDEVVVTVRALTLYLPVILRQAPAP